MKCFTIKSISVGKWRMIKHHHFVTSNKIMHVGNDPHYRKRDEYVIILKLLMEVHIPSMKYSCQKELNLSLIKLLNQQISNSQSMAYEPLGNAWRLLKEPMRFNYFHINTKTLIAFSIVLTFTLMAQKQQWVAPRYEPRSGTNVLTATSLLMTTGSIKNNNNNKFPKKCPWWSSKKVLILFKFNLWAYVFLIVSVMKWEVCIKCFCCKLKYDGCLKAKPLC